jgi:hypothetical protein
MMRSTFTKSVFACGLCVTLSNTPLRAAMQMTRYNGPPDLALTSALVEAGGGANNFDSARLFGVLAGTHATDELAHLTQQYGATRVHAFIGTFTYAIDDALKVATSKGVTLPQPSEDLVHDGRQLSSQLYDAGVMSDRRFDIGYMIEHLVSRPIHVAIMNDINSNPQYGPQVNADFHVILTTTMNDLKTVYGL